MNTDPLYDKQTLFAIVLIAVASAFICGVAIGSYEDRGEEPSVRKQANEQTSNGLMYASIDRSTPVDTEPTALTQHGCFLTLVEVCAKFLLNSLIPPMDYRNILRVII